MARGTSHSSKATSNGKSSSGSRGKGKGSIPIRMAKGSNGIKNTSKPRKKNNKKNAPSAKFKAKGEDLDAKVLLSEATTAVRRKMFRQATALLDRCTAADPDFPEVMASLFLDLLINIIPCLAFKFSQQ